MRKALFLDRDGTLIEDLGSDFRAERLMIFEGVAEGLTMLKDGYLFFIITNQPGIGKGLYTLEDFHRFNDFFISELGKKKIGIERTCMCPHVSGCDCKKPSTKFIDEIAKEFSIDLKNSWVIGNHPSDIVMGNRGGWETAYVLTGHGEKHLPELEPKGAKPTIIEKDFISVAEYIKKEG